MKRKSTDSSATPEQLDQLAWYVGGTEEYPVYNEDAFGRVMTPGYTKEVSLDALMRDDIEGDVLMTPVERGDAPSPADALAKYSESSHLASLSPRERQVYVLTHVCAMWPREVAGYLDISVQTVKNFLQRAKRKLAR